MPETPLGFITVKVTIKGLPNAPTGVRECNKGCSRREVIISEDGSQTYSISIKKPDAGLDDILRLTFEHSKCGVCGQRLEPK
jgi:hypothetical protein